MSLVKRSADDEWAEEERHRSSTATGNFNGSIPDMDFDVSPTYILDGEPQARSAVACNTCRQRHTKCDQKLPECNACVKAKVECTYNVSNKQQFPIMAVPDTRISPQAVDSSNRVANISTQRSGIQDRTFSLNGLMVNPAAYPYTKEELEKRNGSRYELPQNSMPSPVTRTDHSTFAPPDPKYNDPPLSIDKTVAVTSSTGPALSNLKTALQHIGQLGDTYEETSGDGIESLDERYDNISHLDSIAVWKTSLERPADLDIPLLELAERHIETAKATNALQFAIRNVRLAKAKHETLDSFPIGAPRTTLDADLVDEETLYIGRENFQVHDKFITVFRALGSDEVTAYRELTRLLKKKRKEDRGEAAKVGVKHDTGLVSPSVDILTFENSEDRKKYERWNKLQIESETKKPSSESVSLASLKGVSTEDRGSNAMKEHDTLIKVPFSNFSASDFNANGTTRRRSGVTNQELATGGSKNIFKPLLLIFAEDPALRIWCSKGATSVDIVKFARGLALLLQQLGIDLSREAGTNEHRHGAYFLIKSRAERSAWTFCDVFDLDAFQMEKNSMGDLPNFHDDDLPDSLKSLVGDTQSFAEFMKSSKAIQTLRGNLVQLVYPVDPSKPLVLSQKESKVEQYVDEDLMGDFDEDLMVKFDNDKGWEDMQDEHEQRPTALVESLSGTFERREAIEQASGNGDHNISILLFTAITILFLPLSLFTGIYGMDAMELNDGLITLHGKFWVSLIPGAVVTTSIFFMVPYGHLSSNLFSRIRSKASCFAAAAGTWASSWMIGLTPITRIVSVLSMIKRPSLKDGKARIEWKCKYGQNLWDDFQELEPGAADRLERKLHYSSQSRSSTWKNSVSSIGRALSQVTRNLQSMWAAGNQKEGTGLPLHERSSGQTALSRGESQPEITNVPPTELLWLLLCYSQGRYATRLLQLDLVGLDAKSDRSLFTIMRDNYYSMKGEWLKYLSLRSLKSIKFVHFEAYKSELVDVRKQDVIPPPESVEYRYLPAPPELIPPVGENHLLHCFHHPDHAENEPLCLDRFPKKLKEKLQCTKGVNPGWGLHSVEGWDAKAIWIITFLFFGMGSLLVGVLWAWFRHSVQDGFAIAAYMVAFGAVTVGTVQAVLVM